MQVEYLGDADCKCATLKGKISWELRAKKHKKVALHNQPHTRDLLEETQRMVASAWMRSSKELSRRQALFYRIS